MLRKLYNWTISFAESSHAIWILAVISFLESSIFPIPPHVLMIPLIIAQPKRAFLFASIATIFSVAGGALGYYIGAELYDSLGRQILEVYNKFDQFELFAQRFRDHGHLAVLAAGITPFPYKVITITSGVVHMPFASFMIWSLIARSTIFFVIAILLSLFGEPIRNFIEKRLPLMFILFIALLIGGFFLVKYL